MCETSCDKKWNTVPSADIPSGEASPVAKSKMKGGEKCTPSVKRAGVCGCREG